jgi:hypothetical protein
MRDPASVKALILAGSRPVWVLTGCGQQACEEFKSLEWQPDRVAANLLQAVKWILAQERLRA